jgi:hypothetical protein
MNVGLDVRVIDQIGLANPVAAHTARLQHGRIGHDKNLFPLPQQAGRRARLSYTAPQKNTSHRLYAFYHTLPQCYDPPQGNQCLYEI